MLRVTVGIFLFLVQCFHSDMETCQVAIEVEREEDEGGMVGETFTDYVSVSSSRTLYYYFFSVYEEQKRLFNIEQRKEIQDFRHVTSA